MPMTNKFSLAVSPSGQVTIPEGVCEALGVSGGGYVTFIVEDDVVRLVNPVVHALKTIQKEMEGEAEKAGITSDDDVVALVKEIRRAKE